MINDPYKNFVCNLNTVNGPWRREIMIRKILFSSNSHKFFERALNISRKREFRPKKANHEKSHIFCCQLLINSSLRLAHPPMNHSKNNTNCDHHQQHHVPETTFLRPPVHRHDLPFKIHLLRGGRSADSATGGFPKIRRGSFLQRLRRGHGPRLSRRRRTTRAPSGALENVRRGKCAGCRGGGRQSRRARLVGFLWVVLFGVYSLCSFVVVEQEVYQMCLRNIYWDECRFILICSGMLLWRKWWCERCYWEFGLNLVAKICRCNKCSH